MVTLDQVTSSLLSAPSKTTPPSQSRTASSYHPLRSFDLPQVRSYQQQYGDMYFLRLTKIKPQVEEMARDAWEGNVIAGEVVKKVERVLDVRQGELCWVTGTVYMDMALKPNILEDVSKDRWIGGPPVTQKYYSEDGSDQIMLEDESGRIRLVGKALDSVLLVTGCIISVMGTETANGELDVIDIKFPDLPPQPKRWTFDKPPAGNRDMEISNSMAPANGPSKKGSTLAIVSGLSFSGNDASYALELNLLLEFLLGESGDPALQSSLASVSRLIIAGNSIANDEPKEKLTEDKEKKPAVKKYGYDSSTYNPVPSQLFDQFLFDLLPSMPITVLPGPKDPANVAYPQQPIHTAMFPLSRQYAAEPTKDGAKTGWLDTVSNPWEAEIDGWRVLGTAGQNVDDVFKYVGSDDRLGMMEAMCRWRCIAPTAPDTLYSYPFQDNDPFVIKDCPHLFFVGCQPSLSTRVIEGSDGQRVRLVTIPSFSKTHEICLIDMETLEVTKVKINVHS
ncbi:DNA polymerase delta subunit 2 [Ceratocystis fimbriata CBS 114723]|uniref:DNA-directed DNA polymerase n=2 Tax=Ceratocystis TaxID=5157 RepID=A0A2C5X828_9PEZI|nr:DNA polymerase delta subunit 2 [Ceratocystis fimbriata CBS 114723]